MPHEIQNDCETDLLRQTALRYKALKEKGYGIILGRKEKEIRIQLRFPHEAFFHLAGLQHLSDLTYPSYNKERIFKEILNGNITYKTISKSQYFTEYNIQERLTYLGTLESMLDSCSLMFLINPKEYRKYTNIRADYLFVQDHLNNGNDILYFFAIKDTHPKVTNECMGCSFFKKHDKDFTQGTSHTTLLLLEKYQDVDTQRQECTVIYKNPTYIEK